MPSIYQLARRWIDDSESVGVFVCGRAIFIQAGRHARRAAQRDKDPPAIGRRVNAARPFPHWKGSNHVIRGSINHRDVA
jgi:hypothetical protein